MKHIKYKEKGLVVSEFQPFVIKVNTQAAAERLKDLLMNSWISRGDQELNQDLAELYDDVATNLETLDIYN